MPSHIKPNITLVDVVSVLLKLCIIVPKALYNTAYLYFTNSRPTWPLRFILFTSMLQNAGSITMHQRRAFMNPTGDIIRYYAHKRKVTVTSRDHPTPSTSSPNGTQTTYPPFTLHYINSAPSTTGRVLLYLHGGGYCYATAVGATASGHGSLALDLATRLGAQKVALLEYALAPEVKYPGQLAQAIAALEILLRTHSAAQIVVAGDSAGGNLTLALLAHLITPSPYAAPVDLRGERIRAAGLISPWVGLERKTGSYKRNKYIDFIPTAEGNQFLGAWAPRTNEVWADPLVFPGLELRRGLEGVVSDVLITAGAWEVLCDDICDLGARLGVEADRETVLKGLAWRGRSGGQKDELGVEFVVAREEGHCMPVMEAVLDLKPGEGKLALEAWADRLGCEW